MVREIASCYEGAMTPVDPRLRRLLVIGPSGLVVAICLGLLSRSEWIGYLALGALGCALVGLHRLGRAGPDGSLSGEPATGAASPPGSRPARQTET